MDAVLHFSLRLPASPGRAFSFFTEPDELRAWLAPRVQIEPELGGRYELFWDLSDPENDSTLGCRVTAVTPGQLLAFEWKGPRQFKAFMNTVAPLTHVVLSFSAAGDETDVHLLHSGWRSGPEWDAARQWQAKAWELALTALAERVRSLLVSQP